MFLSKRKTLQMNERLVSPLTTSAEEQTKKPYTKTGIELELKSQPPRTSCLHRNGIG